MCPRSKRASLFRPKIFPRRRGGFFFQTFAQPLAHFGGRSLGEGDDEEFVKRHAFTGEAVEATGDERLGFAGAGTGHDEDVAARGDRLPLGQRERVVLGALRFHAALAG